MEGSEPLPRAWCKIFASFAIVLLKKRELVSLLMCSSCHVADGVMCLFLLVPLACLWYVIVIFPGHTYVPILVSLSLVNEN